MRAMSRIVACALVGSLLILSASGADDENKKANPPKDDGKKADVKKDDAAKKDANKDEPAKKEEPAKKMPMPKLPARKGKFKDLETDQDAAKKKMLRKATLTAEVVAVVEDKKYLRVKLTIPYVRINKGQYELATTQKDVELMAADEFKVRMRNPPPQFDDKGRPKRYTKKELQELKGNDKLPGFPAEFSDIKGGQIVEVTLLQNKNAPRPAKRAKDAEPDVTPDNLPKMSMIIILGDPKSQ